MTAIEILGKNAKAAARVLAVTGENEKNKALNSIADAIEAQAQKIIDANKIDMENGRAAGLTPSLLDRLSLDEKRIAGIAQGIRSVAAQPDPVGRIVSGSRLANGLQIERVTVPLGVIGIIYEARPNVTADGRRFVLRPETRSYCAAAKRRYLQTRR